MRYLLSIWQDSLRTFRLASNLYPNIVPALAKAEIELKQGYPISIEPVPANREIYIPKDFDIRDTYPEPRKA